MTIPDIHEFQQNFEKIIAQVQALRGEMTAPVAAYQALVARAAHGEDIAEAEWLEIERAIKSITNRVSRCRLILQHLQPKIAAINSAMARNMAERMAKEFAFFSPAAGHG